MLDDVDVILSTCMFFYRHHDITPFHTSINQPTLEMIDDAELHTDTTKLQAPLLEVTTGKSQSSKIDWSMLNDTNLKYFEMSMSYSPPAFVHASPEFDFYLPF